MRSKLKIHGIVTAAAVVLNALSAAYTTYLKAPAVSEVRPELADVGFWTGMFSGRAMEYLYITRPGETFVVTTLFAILCFNLILVIPE